MRKAIDYLPRRAAELITEALSDTRIVVVNGARQVGKSTLAEVVLRQSPGAIARFLDDPMTRSAAQADPVSFLQHDDLMLIDEVQRVPDLWLAMKHIVDRDPRPGRFILTGSARLLSLQSLPDSLPGRTETIELWPLSQGEIDGGPDGFVDAAFERGSSWRAVPSMLNRKDYLARALRGGFPEAVHRDSERRRERFFADYVSDLVLRDIKQVADIERASDVRRLASLLAAQTGGLLKASRLSNALQVSAPTVRRYISILETIFLIKLIPGWAAGSTARAVSTPKVIFQDSGLAAHLLDGGPAENSIGGLLENLVLGELARQLTWSRTWAQLYHYRDRDQYEVDAILENNAGQIVAIEVKSSGTVRSDDFRGLRLLQRRLEDRFRAGFVLYCGTESFSFGWGLAAMPISALWTTPSPSADAVRSTVLAEPNR